METFLYTREWKLLYTIYEQCFEVFILLVQKWLLLYRIILCLLSSTIMLIEGYSKLSDHPLISKFMKGIYSQHPTLPRYANIWEIIYCWLILSPKQKILTWLWNVWQKS